MAAKRHRGRREISLSYEKENKSNTEDDTDPNQANPDYNN